MALAYSNLDEKTRLHMIEEIEFDIKRGSLYIAVNRLTANGQNSYPDLLKTAARTHSDVWLAEELRRPGMMNALQERRHASGKVTMVKVPITAPDTLAEGEFNRFYIRSLCLTAIADDTVRLVVYRAKAVEHPRPESEALIGKIVDAKRVLADLRENVGWEASLGLGQPNSGLTLRIERGIPAKAV